MLNLGDDAIEAWTRSTALDHGGLAQPEVTAVVSNEVVTRALSRMAELLNTHARVTPEDLVSRLREASCLDDMRAVLEQAGTARAFRMIHWMTADLPDGLALVTDLLDQTNCGLGKAVAESERRALLERIYAPERLRILEETCRGTAPAREAA